MSKSEISTVAGLVAVGGAEGNVVESVISDRRPRCRGYTDSYLGNGKLVGQFADSSK